MQAIAIIACCATVLAVMVYVASTPGIKHRGPRSRIWLALTGAFIGIALAAVVILVAQLEGIVQ